VTIEVVAHRGANDEEPEHSLAAYLRAIEQGADAIECDVRLTADGTLVCVHDRRIDRTSSGRGTVSAMTFDELARHDYSRSHVNWLDFEGPTPDESRTSLLTLDRLLVTLMDASTTVRFAIETKHPVRYGRYVEEELADTLRRFGLDRPVDGEPPRARVMSFSRSAVLRSRRLLPDTPAVFLMNPVRPWYRDGSLPGGVRIAGPSIETLRRHPRYVDRVHGRGGLVHVWTVDDDVDIDLCVSLGVDAIISNRPGHVLRRLGR
jgi:glycerophosphoryl diester phosphodiesterase